MSQKKIEAEKKQIQEEIELKQKNELEQQNLQGQENLKRQNQANQQSNLDWQKSPVKNEIKLATFIADHKNLEKELGRLKENELIKDWSKTENGYKAISQLGKEILMDFKNSTVTLNDNSDNSFATAVQMIKAVGANEVNINSINNQEDKYRFYKAALVENLKVSGLDPKVESQFQQRLEKEKLEQKPATTPSPQPHK